MTSSQQPVPPIVPSTLHGDGTDGFDGSDNDREIVGMSDADAARAGADVERSGGDPDSV